MFKTTKKNTFTRLIENCICKNNKNILYVFQYKYTKNRGQSNSAGFSKVVANTYFFIIQICKKPTFLTFLKI